MSDVEEILSYLLSVSDDEKWRWVIDNRSVLIYLDTDKTYFLLGDEEDHIVEFDSHLGNTFGVKILLDELGIEYEEIG